MPAPAKLKGKGPQAIIMRKVGPLPLVAWVVLGVLGYVMFRAFKGGGAPSQQGDGGGLGPAPQTQATTQSGTSAAADGAGISNSALANILGFEQGQQALLVGGILGAQDALVDVNSNLVGGLINSQNAIVGLGETALNNSGMLQQAIIESYTPAPYAAQTPVASSAPASGAQTVTTYDPVIASAASAPAINWGDQTGALAGAWGGMGTQAAAISAVQQRGSMYTIPSYLSHGGAI